MSKQVKWRRGTTTEHETFIGAVGEVTVDTTKDTLVVHDGVTLGGHSLPEPRDWKGFTDELYAQAGIVDDGQPDRLGDSQRVNAINALIAASKPPKVYAESFKAAEDVDFTLAIKRGIQHCVDNNLRTLYVSSAILHVSAPLGNCPVSLVSDGITVISNTNTQTLGSANNDSIIVFTQGVRLVRGIVFDGGVSSSIGTKNIDPSAWTSENHNTWYGYQGPVFSGASGFDVVDCKSENMYRAGFYITGCSDFNLVRPRTKRNRGVFGDGVFIGNGCHDFTVINSDAYDFTRAGLVLDLGCYDFSVRDNVAEHGHDWSALYGGTEYSAGLWIEKSTRGTASGGRIRNTGYYGVIIALETEGFIPTEYRDFFTMTISNFDITGAFVGGNFISAAGVVGKISVNDVNVVGGSGCIGALLRGHPNLTVDVNGGSYTINGTAAGKCVSVGALGQDGISPIYILRGVGVGHTNGTGAADAKARISVDDVGDVSLYSIAEYDFNLSINGMYSLSPVQEITVGLRTARATPSWHSPKIELSNIDNKVYYKDSSMDFKTTFKAASVDFSNLTTYCLGFNIENCKFSGPSLIYFNSLWEFNKNRAVNCHFKDKNNFINYSGSSPAYTLTPAFMLDSCIFSADLSESNSFLLDIRRVDAGGNRIGWIHRDTIYTNTGTNGVGSVAINCSLNDYNLPAYKYSNIFDVMIADVLRNSSGTVSDPTTVNLGVRENLVLAG